MKSFKTVVGGSVAALAMTVGLGAVALPAAYATTPAATLDGVKTDNYKACWDTTPQAPRTFLSFKSITVGNVTYHHAMPTPAPSNQSAVTSDTRTASTGILLKGSDQSSAWLTASSPAAMANNAIRFDSNGDFGPILTLNARMAAGSTPISETVTVSKSQGGALLASTTASYQYDSIAANAPKGDCYSNPVQSREYAGPGGRWYVGGSPTNFDWDPSGKFAPAPAPGPDRTAPTLQSVTVPATTTTRTITISISASDNVGVSEVRFANEDGTWSAWQPFATTKQWTLSSSASAAKGVSTEVRDAAHNESSSIYKKITCNAPCN